MQNRTNARLAAVQALYQMEATSLGVESAILEFQTHRLGGELEGNALHEADAEFFADLLRGVVRMQTKIDPLLERNLARNWTLGRLDATVRAILRTAAHELFYMRAVSPKAIIDEYIEIANAFFEGEERSFINALLDALWRERREHDAAMRPAAKAQRE